MKYMVTGAAGFIGSRIALALLEQGHLVVGVDNFTDYYSRELKEANLAPLRDYDSFKLLEKDVAELEPENLEGTEVVFHQAAQAGVRKSWGESFEAYTHNNIYATQHLLEICRNKNLKRFVYASSSSIYGEAEKLPVSEKAYPRPVSPYGVSKLAAEHLCNLYHINYGTPVVSLRYFTVYGPGQRPDMAFHIFSRALLNNEKMTVFGDGLQTRDFTYISDAVAANIAAARTDNVEGRIFNIGGGSRVSLNKVMDILENIRGCKGKRDYRNSQKGDPRHTYADTEKARFYLKFMPSVSIEEGLKKEVKYIEELLRKGM